jgi:serine/threonine-protein kinase
VERIGPYRLVRTLGSGGMGVVHLAEDPGLGRQVALKVISPHLAQDPAFRARFTREAQALAALDSPHVVHVYAHGEHDGRPWIATQLVPDGDLGRMLEDHGAPPVRVALDLMAQVAAGLSDAHAAGLVHRDIKPANVLLRRRDSTMQAYLSDFGIARQVDAAPTRAGTGPVGTPTWMAPELHTGATASVATDVYSLGCLLWAALSGHAPYVGTTDYEIVSAHL